MDNFAKFGLVFLLTVCSLSAIDGQDVCVKTGPCSCAFSNGTGIDLQPISKKEFFSAFMYEEKTEGIELSKYFYHPCYNVIPEPPLNATGNNNTCDRSLTLCRHTSMMKLVNVTTKTYTKDLGIYSYMGNANDSAFSANGDAIIYNNLPSNTTVLLVCAETVDTLQVYSLADPNNVILALYSRAACLKTLPVEGGRSLGSTLLIIFFSFTIFYLVLGVCTKKFLMGATGVEVIPNLAFWSDLPNLVKDGWAFTIAGFKLPVRGSGPAMSPDPNSYDSI